MSGTIDELLKALTLAEKASLPAGADMWRTVAVERLGIPSVQVSDGPNGVRGTDDNLGETSVCFPVGTAMGATWNPALIEQVGEALAAEVRHKGAHVLLAPTVNIHRTPLAGRNFECFSEDPFLTGIIAAAYIRGLQSGGVAACIKHFVANEQEFERFSVSSDVAERPLHEIYLEPFRIALEEANPWTLMSSYNRVNGVHASENDTLLRRILKEQWKYDGLVISDWYGTYSENVPAGALDLEMPGPARWMDPEKIINAVSDGILDEAIIDDKVRRLLRLIERVTGGHGDAPGDAPAQIDGGLPRRVATESIVLLRNRDALLPLDFGAAGKPTILVIGENAKWPQIMGGGSSQVNPHYVVSPLEGIRRRAGEHATVEYEIGTPIHRVPPLVDPEWLTTDDGQPGLTLEYFHNLDLAGDPGHRDLLRKSELTWFGTVNPYVDPCRFSLRLSGTLTAPESGTYQLHLWSIGRARLFVEENLLIDQWDGEIEQTTSITLPLESGKPASLRMEYVTDPDSRWRTLRLGCFPPISEDPIQSAVDRAAGADVAIIVAGLTREWESEGFDRSDMCLVGRQDELITRVAAANRNTVVVLNAGAPVEMPWAEDVAAILGSWYGGQEAGNALADILFGDAVPSGKLPTTFPRRLEDTPAFINYPGENGHVLYGEGLFVGYRYYDKRRIEPLFPFGHGLSYTTFAYDNLRLNGTEFGPDEEITVTVDVTNTGLRAGQETVQLYLRDDECRLVRPPQELKAFAKIALEPGETATVTLSLTERSLSFYDPDPGEWVSESGAFTLLVGSSSRDIRLTERLEWKRAPAADGADGTAGQNRWLTN
ncbi:MAG: beta-glucosidase [Spirochaetaceae bacterium]|nr:MAG: beta-glucosidase [Spirochaetaceae bacterium]